MKIPLVDLRAQYAEIKDKVVPAVGEVMEHGRFILGTEVEQLERDFSAYCGAAHGVGVASGTDALILALRAFGIGEGDEVIVPVNTFIATALAVTAVGARPVFSDINKETYTIGAEEVAGLITEKTRAIIPVHLYGQPADMDSIRGETGKRGIYIIEDACQAHGAEYKGKRVGGLGAAGCFSFYPGKNLGAYGDGGMIVTNDGAAADTVRILRDVGRKGKYTHVVKGQNSRLDTIQAAVLCVKLAYLDRWTDARRRWAGLYTEFLKDTPCICPVERPYAKSVYHLYVVRVAERDALLAHLNKNGIGAAIHYPIPLHLQEAYKELGYGAGDFPVAEKIASEIVSLPIYPELGEENVARVAEVIKDF